MDYDWLKYLAAPLGVALYAFLLNYELPSRRARKSTTDSSTVPEQVSESVDLGGSQIGGSNGDFTSNPGIDDARTIDGVSRRIS
jgi:hypothetical protein